MLVASVVVFQQLYNEILHLVTGKTFGEIALDLGNGNRELRLARLYAGGTGRHDLVNFVFCQDALLAGGFELLRLGQRRCAAFFFHVREKFFLLLRVR